jgi:aerobic C4-dicarboxylate transport protein
MKPLGDAFITAIRMVIGPIIFFTVVHRIASMKDMRKVGRVGLKALIYFEIMTTVALVLRTKRVARHAAVNGIARLCRRV